LEQDTDGYYLIHNAQELVEFRDSVKNGDAKNGRLAADIDLSSVCGIIDGKEVNWIPMYANIFDGANHTISNLYINTKIYRQALFESAHSISNLIVDNAFVKSTETQVAGIVVHTDSMNNCHFRGIVIGDEMVGGIACTSKAGVIANCSNYGLIIGNSNVSGIGDATYIVNCYNRGTVKAMNGTASGISCAELNCDEINNAYNSGKIEGENARGISSYEYVSISSSFSLENATKSTTEDKFVIDSTLFLNGAILDSLNEYVKNNPKYKVHNDSISLLPWVQTISRQFPKI